MMQTDDRWLLSYYWLSELTGSLFFGRVVRTLGDHPLSAELTKHYADEAQHAWMWSNCLERFGLTPLTLDKAYQDQYASVIGAPANLMEVLAVTQIFEQRVIGQYATHLKCPDLDPDIERTLKAIMVDEYWHLAWVRKALQSLRADYGEQATSNTLQRYREADRAVFESTKTDVAERFRYLSVS